MLRGRETSIRLVCANNVVWFCLCTFFVALLGRTGGNESLGRGRLGHLCFTDKVSALYPF